MVETQFVNGKAEPVVSVETMRRCDAAAIAGGIPGRVLMGRAAQGIFAAVEWKRPVAILAGGGNNGGDGYALACLLAQGGYAPVVYSLSERLSPDGIYYREQAQVLGVSILPWGPEVSLEDFPILVDALLGTGFQGQVRSPLREAILAINRSAAYVVSVDISSGLNGDTGLGEPAVEADLTVSIGYYKKGLFLGRGPAVSGRCVNVDIGIPLLED